MRIEKESKGDRKVLNCLVLSKAGIALSESDRCLKLTVSHLGFLEISLLDHP